MPIYTFLTDLPVTIGGVVTIWDSHKAGVKINLK